MYVSKNIQVATSIIAGFVILISTHLFTPVMAATSLCPNGQAKHDGNGECVALGEAYLDTNNCADKTSVPAATIDAGVNSVDQFCSTHQGIGALRQGNGEITSIHADCKPPAGQPLDKRNCGIINSVIQIINILSGLVGIIIVLMIIIRGIQYSSARDNPQMTAQAKNGIRDAVIALLAFLFMYSFLQWLVPGGIF